MLIIHIQRLTFTQLTFVESKQLHGPQQRLNRARLTPMSGFQLGIGHGLTK